MRAFRTLFDLELHFFTFLELPLTLRLDGTVVDENIGTAFHTDEPIAFGRVKPFHFPFHGQPSFSYWIRIRILSVARTPAVASSTRNVMRLFSGDDWLDSRLGYSFWLLA